MQSVIYICDWLPPEFGAVGQYALAWAREHAADGSRIVLIGLSSSKTWTETEICGAGSLTIERLHAPAYDKASFRARMVWTLKTNLRLVYAASRHARQAAEIRFTGSPPFLLFFVFALKLVSRATLIYRITDFWPECMIAERQTEPWWMRFLRQATWFLRRRVNRFEVLGYDQQRLLEKISIPARRITLVRDPSPVHFAGDELPLTPPDALRDSVVLLYSGNWGVAHDVDTFVEGYARHHRDGSGRVRLWLNAVGSGADRVEERLRDLGLPFVRTRPVPLAQLPRLLVTPHAHLITLKEAFVGYVLPSKVHACIASDRPILYIGSDASDVHLLCSEGPARLHYHRIRNADAEGVQTALEHIAQTACPISGSTARPSKIRAN